MDLGQKLKEARLRAGLKQEELAEQLQVSRQTISNWENNRSYPDIASVVKLSSLYDLSLDALLKEDQKVLAHFENKAAKVRRFWQLALEYALVMEIVGILLAGQKFQTVGYSLQALGAVGTWISLWMHIRLFDHTKEEIRRFVLGFGIIIAGSLIEFIFPDFTAGSSLLVPVFYLVRSTGPLLVLFSNVWSQFWKSPRFLLILAFLIGVPFFNLLTNLQSAGSLNTDTPFPQDYRIDKVLYPENQEADPAVRIDLHSFADSHTLRIYKNGDEYKTIGTFIYQEPAQTQTEKGIWLLVPENAPEALYRLAVESDDSVTLSYSETEQLQWKWLLREEYLCRISIATYGHTMYTNPDWLLPDEDDPAPYFSHKDVVGNGTLTISIPGLESETLVLTEEYHHGGSVEYNEYQLESVNPGSFALELKTRYDGKQEYALYRIAYKGGEFRFTLTYDLGAKDAFQELLEK